jgi:uncharacterized protein involved in exopolysaccharide biosynthesis/Mrp family chromosome partitioning ATPase
MSDTHMLEPTLVAAIRQNWKLGLAAAALMAAGAMTLLFFAAQGSHTAEASILLENPREAVLFQSPNVSSVDYVADQIDILRSAELARRSADSAQDVDPSFPYDTIDYLTRALVVGGGNQALVTISFEAESPEWAVLGANSMVTAYQEFLESETTAAFSASISALDEEVEALEEEISAIQDAIEVEAASGIEGAAELEEEIAALVPVLTQIATDLPRASDSAREELLEELAAINDVLVAARIVGELEGESSELSVLTRRLERLVDRVGSMSERRDNLRVDASLLGRGVRLATPAIVSEETSITGLRTLLAVAFLAGLAGVGAAYAGALRKRAFRTPTESSVVLGAPVLGVLSQGAVSGVAGSSSGRGGHQSHAFISGAVADWVSSWSGPSAMLVSVSAAVRQAGVTSTTAGFGQVLAAEGYRTLLVDADFESRDLTRLLAPSAIGRPGLAELIDGTTLRGEAIVDIESGSGQLALLAQGKRGLTSDDAMSIVPALLDASEAFDIVIVDVPANLTDPRLAALLEGSHRVVVLVGHGDRMFEVERLRDDLDALQAVCDGVVFTKVPGQRMARTASG